MLDSRHNKLTRQEYDNNIKTIRTLRALITPKVMVLACIGTMLLTSPIVVYLYYICSDELVAGRRTMYGIITSSFLTSAGVTHTCVGIISYKWLNDNNFHIGSQTIIISAIAILNVINWDIISLMDSPDVFYGMLMVHNLCFSMIVVTSILHNLYFIQLDEQLKNDSHNALKTIDATKSVALFEQATVQVSRFDNECGNRVPTIYDVISDPDLREVFSNHLEREFAIENLLFIQEIVRYKSAGHEKGKAIAKILIDDFMLSNSLNEVNLPGPLVKATVKSIEGSGLRVDTFDEALHHILFMLETDQLPKFLKSNLYKKYLEK